MSTSTLDLILRIISTPATLALGVAASMLAYQQFRISKANLRFQLYEQRLRFFVLTDDLLRLLCVRRVELPRAERISTACAHFRDNSREAEFLFDEDVTSYLMDIYIAASKIGYIKELLERAAADEPVSVVQQWSDVTQGLYDLADKKFEVFG